MGYRTIPIDLAHTTFIYAGIIGVLVGLARRCREDNAVRVTIINARGHLRKLLSVRQLEGLFGMEDAPGNSDKPRPFEQRGATT
ncbi:MAG TPA: hypothetical protein VNF68_00450 [Candidatus Baltobacteraceae bacterium]|nr:hypothetical protein [Candidatus Baltobacteraceae bacterium]